MPQKQRCYTYNRTMLELKLNNERRENWVDNSYNRTMLELKLEQ